MINTTSCEVQRGSSKRLFSALCSDSATIMLSQLKKFAFGNDYVVMALLIRIGGLMRLLQFAVGIVSAVLLTTTAHSEVRELTYKAVIDDAFTWSSNVTSVSFMGKPFKVGDELIAHLFLDSDKLAFSPSVPYTFAYPYMEPAVYYTGASYSYTGLVFSLYTKDGSVIDEYGNTKVQASTSGTGPFTPQLAGFQIYGTSSESSLSMMLVMSSAFQHDSDVLDILTTKENDVLFLLWNQDDPERAGGIRAVWTYSPSAVPEPAAWSLFFVGVGLISVYRRVRNRHQPLTLS